MEHVKAADLIRKAPAELSLDDPAHYIFSIMEECRACHLPVTTNGQLLGLVSRPKTTAAKFFSPGFLVARDFMKPHPISTRAEEPLAEVAFLMAVRRLDCLPVLGKREQLIGMIHIHDIVSTFLGEFAERIGERARLLRVA